MGNVARSTSFDRIVKSRTLFLAYNIDAPRATGELPSCYRLLLRMARQLAALCLLAAMCAASLTGLRSASAACATVHGTVVCDKHAYINTLGKRSEYNSVTATAAAPVCNKPDGSWTTNFFMWVQVHSATPGGIVLVTTDGSDPRASGTSVFQEVRVEVCHRVLKRRPTLSLVYRTGAACRGHS